MKPKVICHIMASVDGHIQVEHWTAPYVSDSRSEIMQVYAETGRMLQTDAWTFGRNTLRDIFPDRTDIFPIEEKHVEKDAPVMAESSYQAERRSERMFISFDPESDIIYTSSQLRGCDIVVVLSMHTATPRYLSLLRGMGISYLVVADITKLKSILEQLNAIFGIQKISLQGGGLLDGAMLSSGAIDELSLVIYPGLNTVDGSVSIFDKIKPHAISHTSLQLISTQTMVHGVVWLRYKVV